LDAAAPFPRNLRRTRPVGDSLEGSLSAELPALRVTLRRLAAGTPGLDAEDLLQETMQRALRYRHAYDPRHPLGAWLNGIALRVFLDQRKRQRSQPRALGETDAAVAAAGASLNGYAAAVPDPLLAADLDRLLVNLSSAERDALDRFHLRGQSIAEIARANGAAEGTVKSLLYRARRRLAERAHVEDWL